MFKLLRAINNELTKLAIVSELDLEATKAEHELKHAKRMAAVEKEWKDFHAETSNSEKRS